MKRLNAPSAWMLDKMGGVWAPKCSAGPHKVSESMPLVLVLRNRLKYALTRQETIKVCMNKSVRVDGKVRTDINFPCGFQDVVSVPAADESYRVMYDAKGRFVLHKVKADEKDIKLCKVVRQAYTTKRIPFIVTHDGRTIRYPHPDIKVNDSVVLNTKTNKIEQIVKFDIGNSVMIVKGGNTGRVGVIVGRDRHPGSFDIVHVRDASGVRFATRMNNVFMIGTADEEGKPVSVVTLPRGKGVKKSIMQERERRLAMGGH